jgi:hypothetical protein
VTNMKKSFILCILLFLSSVCCAHADFFSLEITNIKPSGTGSPSIPSTNRIFRAYPGIEYNIRTAVIGGVYPYTYSLDTAPDGMTINSRTGEISWPSPSVEDSPASCTVRVVDQESTAVTASWSITVSTTGFIFVDSSHSGAESGTLSEPYSSMINMLNNESTTTDIVMFRAGSYYLYDFNSTADYVQNINSSPQTWLAYPEENPVIRGSGAGSYAYRIYVTSGAVYFDGVTFEDLNGYCLYSQASLNYITVRRCKFDGLVPLIA